MTTSDSTRYTESHIVTLVKTPQRRLAEPSMRRDMEKIIQGTITGVRAGRGWSASIMYRPVDPTDGWDSTRVDPISPDETFANYSLSADFETSGTIEVRIDLQLCLDTDKKRDAVRVELEQIITVLHARGQYPKWSVEKVDGEPFTISKAQLSAQTIVTGGQVQLDAADAIGYAPCVMPKQDAWDAKFKHLFGLNDQIDMVRSPLVRAMQTGWAKRFHTVLIGPPGCGKSAILRAMRDAVGDESVMEFDATSTTAAGAIEILGGYDELPRVLIVEELEKAPTDTFQFLLGLMDDRSEVRKITARKKVVKETKLLTFATCNDEAILKRAMDGALYSRFSNPIYFSRPSRDLLTKILERECGLYGGDLSWIEPTLDLTDALAISDPRRVISLMMLGGNDLLTGEFQRRLQAVGMAHNDGVEETADSQRSRLATLVRRIQSGE